MVVVVDVVVGCWLLVVAYQMFWKMNKRRNQKLWYKITYIHVCVHFGCTIAHRILNLDESLFVWCEFWISFDFRAERKFYYLITANICQWLFFMFIFFSIFRTQKFCATFEPIHGIYPWCTSLSQLSHIRTYLMRIHKSQNITILWRWDSNLSIVLIISSIRLDYFDGHQSNAFF